MSELPCIEEIQNVFHTQPSGVSIGGMKTPDHFLSRIPACCLVLGLAVAFFAPTGVPACSIFVLTDTRHALFCNNEDGPSPKTRIWFLPAGDGYHGAVYVGYDDGYAQGGLNTEGLAYDWVSGFKEEWNPDPHLPTARRDSSQRMLETCTTVNDAIAFYRTHREPLFWRGKILVADRTGASVIIGATNGQLQVEADNQCRGFGHGGRMLDAALAKQPQPTVADGFNLLRDCRQTGPNATKYSNIYDLKSGDIYLHPIPTQDDEVTFNLAAELRKGAHYYELPQIKEQLAQAPRSLPIRLRRFPLDEFKPIPDQEPAVTAHFQTMILDAADGTPHTNDYMAEAWKILAPNRAQIQATLKTLGDFNSMTLVERSEDNGLRTYRYRLELANATLLQRFVLNGQNLFTDGGSDAVELRPGAFGPEMPSLPAGGIGVMLRVDGENIIIQEIVPDSPAAQKNLHVGDRIIAVAQDAGPAVPVHGGKLAEVVELIRGHVGATVRLTIVPAGENDAHSRVVSLVRAELKTH